MSIRPIVAISGDPATQTMLRSPTSRIDPQADPGVLKQLVDDLVDTLLAHPVCIGLSANQIGIPVSAAVVSLSRDVANDLAVLINPRIVSESGKKDRKFESCMSLPRFRGQVESREKIQVQHLDLALVECVAGLRGFEARAWRHEIDHLGGTLYDTQLVPGFSLQDSEAFDYPMPSAVSWTPEEARSITARLAEP